MKKIQQRVSTVVRKDQVQNMLQEGSESPGSPGSPPNAGSLASSTRVKVQANNLNFTSAQLKEIAKRLENQAKVANTFIESGRAVGDALKEYGTKVTAGSNAPLGPALVTLGDFHRSLEDARSDLNNVLNSRLTAPLKGTVRAEIKEALESDKRFEKARGSYETSINKVKGLNDKSKVNLAKLTEAEQECEQAKTAFEEVEKDSYKTLTTINAKLEFEVLARMVASLEAYYDFFENTFVKMQQLMPQIQEYRQFVEQRMVEFEKQTGIVVERILETKSIRESKKVAPAILAASPSVDNMLTSSSSQIEKPQEDDFAKKKRILQEVVSAERIYVNNLRSIKQNFFVHLQKLQKSDPKIKISDDELATIFYRVDEMFLLHDSLYNDLDQALLEYPYKSIGKIFSSRLSAFEKYIDYADNFSNAMNALSTIKRSRQVNNMV